MPLASAHHAARTQALACQSTAIPSHLRSLHDATPWRDACVAVTAAFDHTRPLEPCDWSRATGDAHI
jgi:hypothetical protein